MKTSALLTAAVLAVLGGAGHARAQTAASDAPKLTFEKQVLANGLTLILHVDRKLPVVHVNQWFHVGSKNEKLGRTGFAHLFEHLMFQGSKNVPGEYFSVAEKAGANLREGGVNGTTNNDRTNYFITAPAGSLEKVLWLEADRLATLTEVTDQKKLDNQRDVVKNERRQGLENQPYGRAFKLLYENVFPNGHPYSWPVIGSPEDLTAASLDDVKDFFRQYYTPNNLSLVIAGDFDPAEAKRLVEKYFGPIPAGPPLDRPQRLPVVLGGEKIVEVNDRVPQERTYLAWPSPEFFAADDAELDLASSILSTGLSSRLNKALVYDKQLCTQVNAFQNGTEIAGMFVVQLTARPGAKLAEIERIAGEELARFAKSGPTAAELARAKTKLEFDFVSGLERIGGFGGKADLLNRYQTFLGDPDKIATDLGRYRAATREGVRKAVDRWLNNRNRLVLRFHPEPSGRPSEVAIDRTKEPPFGTDKRFVTPPVKEAKLDNGLTIFVAERPDLPKVSVVLVTRAGAVADPPGKSGLATAVMRTIDMGTRTRKALEIEDALGDLGTALGGDAGRESATLGLDVLKRNLGPAVDIMADVIQHPTFPAADVDREKKRLLDQLSQVSKNASAVSGRVRSVLAFGADHPYGRPVLGLPSTVSTITREDLARFHETQWRPGSSALIFAGAITLDEAVALARKDFGAWPAGSAPEVTIPPPSPAPAGRIYLVDRQDAAQTVVSQFLPAPKRATDDYHALRLADAVWGGGGFGTRLNLNLREDKGYSYGVFSGLNQYRSFGLWSANGGVQTNKTKESLVEFDKEMKAFAGGKPITQAEFDDARDRRVRGYAQAFESLGRVSQQIGELWTLGLPMSELQNEVDMASKQTLDAARAAATKYALPAQSSLLLVGDRAKIEAGIAELKLAPIVLVDDEGKILSPGAAHTSK